MSEQKPEAFTYKISETEDGFKSYVRVQVPDKITQRVAMSFFSEYQGEVRPMPNTFLTKGEFLSLVRELRHIFDEQLKDA